MNRQLAHSADDKFRTKDVHTVENVEFTAMLLSDAVLQGLLANGFKKPSPIQLKAIPMGRCGYDLIIQAKSGTGKTAVFGIIALEMVDTSINAIQALILAPTREIAVQIQDVLQTIGMYLKDLKVEYFIGGTSIQEDLAKLKHCHIAVGAPGRIKHLIKSGNMKVDYVKLFVLDEADKLLFSGQHKDINFIYNKLRYKKQMIASSATYPGELKQFLTKYMQTPTIIDLQLDVPILLGIRQFVSIVKYHLNVVQQMNIKNEELIRLFQNISFNQCIVFCNYQTRAETLSNTLNRQGWPTTYISAAQNQKSRLEAVNSLKEFKCRILCTTDLTARGIDAANVDLIINYEIPVDTETYLHRMGRAGRYGSSGLCISIVTQGKELEKFQNLLNKISSTMCVLKLDKEKIPENIWTCDINDFEKLHRYIQSTSNVSENICDTLKELSVNKEPNNDKTLLDVVKKIENDVKETCKNKLKMSPADIFEVLSNRDEINISNTESKETSEEINVADMLANLNKEDEIIKSDLKNKLNSNDPSNVLNLLLENKLHTKLLEEPEKIKKSKIKKVKQNENSNNSNNEIENNKQFENEAKLFQENTILNRNIALFNLTKVVVEQDAVSEENVNSAVELLKIMEHEDNLEIKEQKSKLNFTDLLNHLGIPPEEKQVDINKWEVVSTQNVEENECNCPENLFTNMYNYAILENSTHWINNFCDIHKNIETEDTPIVKNEGNMEQDNYEYNEENYAGSEHFDENEYYDETEYYDDAVYYDANDYYDDENECHEETGDYADNEESEITETENMETEVEYDEEIFSKAYEYALTSEILNEAETTEVTCDESNTGTCGYAAAYCYDHLKPTIRKRKRNKKNKKVTTDVNNENYTYDTYDSYFEYYNNLLAETGPQFTDVSEFEKWFKTWQENVFSVRNCIQEEIFAKERMKDPNSIQE